jgi:hypothetical protein
VRLADRAERLAVLVDEAASAASEAGPDQRAVALWQVAADLYEAAETIRQVGAPPPPTADLADPAVYVPATN